MSSVYVGAYWRDRAASLEECSAMVRRLLEKLAGLDSSLASWFPKGVSARRGASMDMDSLQKAFRVNRRDTDRVAIAELGYSLGMWNGSSASPVGLTGTFGGYASKVGVSNNCVLTFDEGLAADLAVEVVASMVDVLDPESCFVTSHQLRESTPLGRLGIPAAGWVTFVPSFVEARDGWSVTACRGGSIVRVSPVAERFSWSQPSLPRMLGWRGV